MNTKYFYQLLIINILYLTTIYARRSDKCNLPRGRSCTSMTPTNTKLEGLGVYYEDPCHGAGCGFFHSNCRLCWIDQNAPGRADRLQCPPCVAERFQREKSEDAVCSLPRGRSCTSMTPENTKLEGLGVYYENPCHGVGCGFFHSNCRLCWIDPNAPGRADRLQCPPCVSKILNKN
ncbi:hypothetical protein I4U23_027126 [Adineta vaga]|nr:hypothetical protein I4U23_027126 [Adineta vaga]